MPIQPQGAMALQFEQFMILPGQPGSEMPERGNHHLCFERRPAQSRFSWRRLQNPY
jgi:hypothetical protein